MKKIDFIHYCMSFMALTVGVCLPNNFYDSSNIHSAYYAEEDRAGTKMIGHLKAPQNIDKLPAYRIFFAGQEVKSDENGFFTIPLERKINEFYMLICSRFHANFQKTNTIKELAIKEDKYHNFYKIKQSPTGEYQFFDARNELKKGNFAFPENCLVITISPAYVKELAPWKVNFPSNYLKLPILVLTEKLSKDLTANEKKIGKGSLMRASNKSILYHLDARPFHAEIKTVSKTFHDRETPVQMSIIE